MAAINVYRYDFYDPVLKRDRRSVDYATGDAIIWLDRSDGLVYVAAPSGQGLILFRRGADGSWTYRSVSMQTQGENPVQDFNPILFPESRTTCV